MKKGRIFVVSAPSGSGKTTLCERILANRNLNLVRSISLTTRPPRPGEKAGRDYLFTTAKDFARMIKKRELLEWAKVFENFYGTPRQFAEANLIAGKNVLLNIDVQGAAKIKRKIPRAVLIYIAPPSLEVLEERLKKRNTDNATEIAKRLKTAREELKKVSKYKYVILNDDIEIATRELRNIIEKEIGK